MTSDGDGTGPVRSNGGEPASADPTPPASPRRSRQALIEVGLVVGPVVALWLLLLLAPASTGISLATRIGAGVFFTVLLVPIMRFRTKGLLRHIDRW